MIQCSKTLGQFDEGAWTELLLFLFLIALTGGVTLIETRRLGLSRRMLHRHASHNEAVARIGWCIAERSIGVVTGEVGAGKTVSVRTALAALDVTRYTVIYLPNPQVGVRGIHEAIITAFGANPTNLSSRLITQATTALAAERDERGRTPVLVLDEAHLLSYEQLETIRMLTNHSMDLLTELPGLSSQFSGQVRAGGVTVPDHDRIGGVWPGPCDDRGPAGRGAAGDRRSVGALAAGRSRR